MPVLPFGEGKSSFGARPSSKERQCGSQAKFKNAWRIATAAKLGCDKVHNQIERDEAVQQHGRFPREVCADS